MWLANVRIQDQDTNTGEKTLKGAIVLAAAIVAIGLGACRREEAPLKLGGPVASTTDVAR